MLQDIDEHEQHHIEKVAGNINEESDEEFWEETHELLSDLTLFLILLHTAGVILSSRLQRQNLNKSMIYARRKSTKNNILKDKHSLSIKTG
ncbi:MAG: cytochrome b [Glaciecola sp.]